MHDALPHFRPLYDSSLTGSRDAAGPAQKFCVPTIVNGRVYIASANQLDVYGLIGPAKILSTSESQYVLTGADVTLSATAAGDMPLSYQWFFKWFRDFRGDRTVHHVNKLLRIECWKLHHSGHELFRSRHLNAVCAFINRSPVG